jgi:hypothetical protein
MAPRPADPPDLARDELPPALQPSAYNQAEPTNQPDKRGFVDTLKRQFREVMKRLTHRAPVPAPRKKSRIGSGVGERGFRMVAANITRQAVRRILPQLAQSVPLAGNAGWDLVSWLDQWSTLESAGYEDYAGNDSDPACGLSLHL